MHQISLKAIRQVAAEVLACAVTDLFPGSKLVKGDASDIGFYYDFVLTIPPVQETLVIIEERMRGIFKEFFEIEQLEMMRENAVQFFLHKEQPFKAQELENFETNIVPILKIGDFYDVGEVLLTDLKSAEAFKLLSVENKRVSLFHYDKNGEKVYEKVDVLRINGIADADKKELKNFLKKLEAAKKLDYFTLGVEMGLFAAENPGFSDLCWLPKGQFVKEQLINFLKAENKLLGFRAVSTPLVVKKIFAEKKDLQLEIEGEEYALAKEKFKLHALLFKAEKKAQELQELPVRYFEVADEADYATIFCKEQEALQELISSLQLMGKAAKLLGLETHYILHKGKSGKEKKAAELLEKALNSLKLEFAVDKEAVNEYINSSIAGVNGPTIELEVQDALKRKWCISTLQLVEKKADLAPVVISRSIFRSFKQFIALLLEKSAGYFPLWLAENEAIVLPIAERNVAHARKIEEQLKELQVRVLLDDSSLKLGEKIEKAERKKIPYMLIVGDNEIKNGTVAVRSFREKDATAALLSSFLERLASEKELDLSYLK